MTDAALFTEYLTRERRDMATPKGADIEGIMAALAAEQNRPVQEVRRIVADYTLNMGAG